MGGLSLFEEWIGYGDRYGKQEEGSKGELCLVWKINKIVKNKRKQNKSLIIQRYTKDIPI